MSDNLKIGNKSQNILSFKVQGSKIIHVNFSIRQCTTKGPHFDPV